MDLSANYQVNDMLNLYGRVENLTDEADILGRHPHGARPNKQARTATVGVRYRLTLDSAYISLRPEGGFLLIRLSFA